MTETKADLFRGFVQQLETNYSMLSVSLNEAIELRHTGKVAKSCQAAYVLPGLCRLLSHPLSALLRALGEHAKHHGTMPNAAPLNPENFQGTKEQRAARISGLLSKVMLTQRSQFLHKIGVLQEMVEDLGRSFSAATEELAEGVSIDPAPLWATVDASHFDLNTCLREAIVLLKSFLVAVPEQEVQTFQKSLQRQMRAPVSSPLRSPKPVRHRRMAPIAGQ